MPRSLVLTLLVVLWASIASAQTVYTLPSPLPEVVRVEWDHNPANTQEYYLEIDGTRVSLGPASFLNPASTPVPGRPADSPQWHYNVILMANARQLLASTLVQHSVRLVAQTPKYMKDGVVTVDDAFSPMVKVDVKAVTDQPPPTQYPISGFTITFTGQGSITVVPK